MFIYGHRGAAGEAPENTLTGFAYARAIGVRDYEFDLHLTRDAQVIVIHDSSVTRTTGGQGVVEAMTLDEVRRLSAYAKFPDWPERPTIPTLDEVLNLIADGRSFQLEIKTVDPASYPTLLAGMRGSIDRFGLAERVFISSFDPLALQAAQESVPEITRNYITNTVTEEYLPTALSLGCRMVSPRFQGTSAELVEEMHAAGLLVCAWLGNDIATLDTMVAWRVDAITTDYPSQALKHLGSLAE